MALHLRQHQDGGYQRREAAYSESSDSTHSGSTWKLKQLKSDPVHSTPKKINMYPTPDLPSIRPPNPDFNIKDWSDKKRNLVAYLVSAISTFEVKEDEESHGFQHISQGFVDHQVQPRVPLPTVPPQSYTPTLQRTQPSIVLAEPQSAHQGSQIGTISNLALQSSLSLPPPGPPPGPGPGPSFKPTFAPATLSRRTASKTFSLMSQDKTESKIRNLRLEIWGLRSKIHDTRKILRQKQYAKSIADDQYFQFVRSHSPLLKIQNQDFLKEQKTISDLIQACQLARDEYGPLEDDCNLLEDHLDDREFELQKLEEASYRAKSEIHKPNPAELVVEQYSPTSSIKSGSSFGTESHPLVAKYLSKLGDVDILQERFDWRVEEKFQLEGERESRALVNLELPLASQTWLDNYEIEEEELLKQLDKAEEEAEQLKQECLMQGLVDEDGNPTDFERQERETFSRDVDAGSEKSEFVKFPNLLPRHGTKQTDFRDSGPKEEEYTDSAGDHINQWLLHQLRSSPLYVSLLASTFESNFGQIERQEWEKEVLALWYKDGARKEAADYHTGSSGTSTPAPDQSQELCKFPLEGGKAEYSRSRLQNSFLGSPSLRSISNSGSETEATRKYGLVVPPIRSAPFSQSL